MKILIADDDRDLLGLIAFTLTQAGYLVVRASDGPAAIRAFTDESPALVVLDINMPGASGFQVCEAIRVKSRVPVMMLTVRGEEEDLVRALELGADDYLNKPFSPRTLLARIKALLRRAGVESTAPLAVGQIALDVEEHTVKIGDGVPVRLIARLEPARRAHFGRAHGCAQARAAGALPLATQCLRLAGAGAGVRRGPGYASCRCGVFPRADQRRVRAARRAR